MLGRPTHRVHCTDATCPDAEALETLDCEWAITGRAAAHERDTGHEVQVLDVTTGFVRVVPRAEWAGVLS